MEFLSSINFYKPIRTVGRVLAAATLLLAVVMPPVAGAAETAAKKDPASRIMVTADKLISDNQGRQAEFIGNVRVTQGKTVIQSNRLKIYFGKGGAGSENIDKIVAQENVRIHFDDKTARSDAATYIVSERKLVLEGGDARVQSGDNLIRGTRITLYRENDRIQVEGNAETRVEAVFFPKGDVLE